MKYFSPTKSKQPFKGCASELPTANNSFHTNLSSPSEVEQTNHADDYDSLGVNSPPKRKLKENSSRKRSEEDNVEGMSGGSLNNSLHENQTNKPKKSEDFKTKFKTEICKFWQLNKICKFGDNVIIIY